MTIVPRKCRDCPATLPEHPNAGRPRLICAACAHRARRDRSNRRARKRRIAEQEAKLEENRKAGRPDAKSWQRWTDDDHVTLLDLREKGYSWQRIGELMERSASSVKLRHSVLRQRGRQSFDGPERRSRTPGIEAPPPRPPEPRSPPAARTCQWIEGEPSRNPDYCGKPCVQGRSYCAEHMARAYRSFDDGETP